MIDGVINVYKEKGYTSHDVVAKLRGILGQKKIGHTGTLDPDAEGVLPVCLGSATRLCDSLTDKHKVYRAGLLLGKETDTQDVWGKVIREQEASQEMIDEETVRNAILGFVGEYAQIPPMYSALKVNGRKLYELARAGKVVERKPRQVWIYDIRIETVKLPRVIMTVHCSRGTYIRTLCHDIGRKLGCGGCMESLVRTRAERFLVEDSLTLAQIEALRDQGTLRCHIRSVEEMVSHYPAAVTGEAWDVLVRNGNPLSPGQVTMGRDPGDEEGEACFDSTKDGARFRVYDSRGNFMGIYQWERDKGRLKPWKMFLTPDEHSLEDKRDELFHRHDRF